MMQTDQGATNFAQNYIVYRTEASGDQVVGYVTNNILWDGVSPYEPGSGLAMIPDPDRLYPIGSTYTASTAPSSTAE